MKGREVLANIDWVLCGAAMLLVMIGLAMLFSATYTQQGLFASRFTRQAAAAIVAALCGFFFTRLPYHVLRRYVAVVYGGAVLGLVGVFLGAHIIRGAASRLTIAGVQVQPSEFMKVGIVLMLAWIFTRRDRLDWRVFLQSVLVIALPLSFIFIEPDLGTGALMLALWGALLIFIGLPLNAIFGLSITAGAASVVAWKWLFAAYQKTRLLVFLDPTRDPLGAGYNVVQSIIALGSGRLFGRGLGHGPQSQLKFLPEQHTDFILSSIGEELGFIGIIVVVALYAVVLWRILVIARSTRDLFGQLIAVGTFLILLVSFAVSAGMNMGLLPVTGIPLPLISYGGSNLVSTFVLLGIVESVHVYSKWVQAPPQEISYLG